MARPLLITDCDEVLLHMVSHFDEWLGEAHGIHFAFESGSFGGAMTALGDGVGVTGLRVGYEWEGRLVTTQVVLSPTIIIADHADILYPTAWLSVRMGFAL